ncbi:MAG: DUF1554 domain-containing protein [bacterium]|nr:DUF1554 domain-containing protein [bacterium]
MQRILVVCRRGFRQALVSRVCAAALLCSATFGGSACAQYSSEPQLLAPLVLGALGGSFATASSGVSISFDTALLTSESGTSASMTVVLTREPTADVFVNPVSADPGEGTLSVGSLVFTRFDWFLPQTLTVTGVDDGVTDGNQSYVIDFGSAVSADGTYSGLPVGTVSVINTDNEGARVTLAPTAGLSVSENLTTADFFVVLNTMPASNVIVDIVSGDAGEGSVAPASLTFSSANWNVPQRVTVTGVDDGLNDGTQNFTISASVNVGTVAPAYAGLPITDTVAVSNSDNDTPGITVTPAATPMLTTEAAVTSSYTVVLDSEPTANVSISMISSDTTEGTIAPAALTFTAGVCPGPGNWCTPQTVTVTGVNDDLADTDQSYTISFAAATSVDTDYAGLTPATLTALNSDNDTPGVTVTPTTGLITTENATTATFTVVLTSQPTGNVVIPLSSDTTAEATVSPASLTFTAGVCPGPGNWCTPQTVTVTGVDDVVPVADGSVAYNIITGAATSTDPDYNNRNPDDVAGTNANNDLVGIISTPVTGLITSEGPGTTTFTVQLNTQPAANVRVGKTTAPTNLIRSLDTSEGTVSPSFLDFTPANWNVPQTVTITGVPDALSDGGVIYQIDLGEGVSADPLYDGLAPTDNNGATVGDLNVRNCDTNAERIAGCVTPEFVSSTTTEAGASVQFFMILSQAPTANVSFNIVSPDLTEITVSPGSLTFTSANWNVPQVVTVTGVDDPEDDGNTATMLQIQPATSADPFYNGFDSTDPTITNTDNDTAGILLTPTTATVTENGGTANFSIRLNSRPTASVTVPLQSSDTTEGTLSTPSVTFTNTGGVCTGGGNWCTAQTVTVTGVDDTLVDGNTAFSIQTGPGTATSGDANYNGLSSPTRTITNTDNDRYLFVTAATHSGDFDNDAALAGGVNAAVNADGSPIAEMDNFCAVDANVPVAGTYKAVVADGTHRRASLTANAGDSQIDWVLAANTDYRRADTTGIVRTDANSIFVFGAFTNSVTVAVGKYWTGLSGDWTTAANDCTNFAGTAGTGQEGDANATGTTALDVGAVACTTALPLVCAQQ